MDEWCTDCAEYDHEKHSCPRFNRVIRSALEDSGHYIPKSVDPIDRQAAIDAICKACSIVGDYHKCDGYPETSTWCEELVALRALPSVQQEQWIPCSKRLPKKAGKYYVSGGGKVWICEFVIVLNSFAGVTGGWCNPASNPVVQAWMPLPEAYKERREEGAQDG